MTPQSADDSPPKIVLETSAAIAYLNGEPEWEPVDQIVKLAEQRKIEVFMSNFAWDEIKVEHSHDTSRLEHLKLIAQRLPKVARFGEWILGEDVLGHNSSREIEHHLAPSVSRSRPDVEQFLSFCAQAEIDFFVTYDKGFSKATVKTKVHEKFGFRVGKPADCLEWLRRQKLV